MRKWRLLPKMAAVGIRNNSQLYGPYLLTCMGMTAMIYILSYLGQCEMVKSVRGASYLQVFMYMGLCIAIIVAFLIILYANNFVVKSRRREWGLYNILGLEKRHIAGIMFCESFDTFLISGVGGIIIGILFSKLMELLLTKLVHFPVTLDFKIDIIAIIAAVLVLGGILFIALIHNLRQVRKSNAIELMHSEAVGEKEPKTRWLLAVIGLVTMAAGYIIANTVQDPVLAMAWFFIAVLLVIIGTHCLFTAGSIAVLKVLRANKKYYYQANHFIAVSGMLYRMKQNASGLAHICILCTMVLVTISTTFTMYYGTDENIRKAFPDQYNMNMAMEGYKTNEELAEVETELQKRAAQQQLSIEAIWTYRLLNTSGYIKDNVFRLEHTSAFQTNLVVMTAADYQFVTGKKLDLSENQVAYASYGPLQLTDGFQLAGKTYQIATIIDYPSVAGRFVANESSVIYLVVSDDNKLQQLVTDIRAQREGGYLMWMESDLKLNGTDENIITYTSNLFSDYADRADCKPSTEITYYSMFGGFMFLGIILGIMFLMITTLIMYYKQVTEGYQDRSRYEIMQQVGMTQTEVRKSITSQILTVFFLPVVVAGIHVAGSFHMIRVMLQIFSIDNVSMFIQVTLVTLAGFALIYALMYHLTARTYYKIISIKH